MVEGNGVRVKRKWVLLSLIIILFLFMFYIAFKSLYLSAYLVNTDKTELSWLTTALRNLNLISGEATYVVNPKQVMYLLSFMIVIFVAYTLFTLFLDTWFRVDESNEQAEPVLFDRNFYKKDNAILSEELNKTNNLVIAIDDVSLFLNSDLLKICSESHFILLSDDIIERFQHATEIVKSPEMKERYEEILHALLDNPEVRGKVIYYHGSEKVINQYYLDQTYPPDKFLAACISAAHDDGFSIKVVSRNEAIVYKAKQLGFSTFKLSSLLDEHKEVNVWKTEEEHGIVH